MQGDVGTVRIHHGHEGQTAPREGAAQLPAIQAHIEGDAPAKLLTQAKRHQGSQPFLPVEGGGHQDAVPPIPQHQPHDFPPDGAPADRQGVQKPVPPPQGGDNPPDRSGIHGLGDCDACFGHWALILSAAADPAIFINHIIKEPEL